MNRRRLIFVATAFWASAASADEAQTAKERHELRLLVSKYAQCVVRKHHDEVRTALMSNAEDKDILRHHGEIFDSDCMQEAGDNVGVKFAPEIYQYELAEASVRADFPKTGPESFADRLPLAHLPLPTQANLDMEISGVKSARKIRELRKNYDIDYRKIVFAIYSECIARVDPVGTRFWILTKPDVPEELSRIKALMPAFQQCMKPGLTAKFSREELRGAAALSYYRLANATPQRETGAVH